jgi:phosphatidylinositol phospholipase C delta
MTDPGRRILRRAANLLTSNGHPVVTELDDPHEEALALARSRSPTTTNLRLAASIKRKFKEVAAAGVARSKTFSARSAEEPSWNSEPKHARALSQSATQAVAMVSEPVPRERVTNSQESVTPTMTDVTVPQALQQGTPLTKVSAGKKQKTTVFRIDPDEGQILWESKKHRISTCSHVRPISYRC